MRNEENKSRSFFPLLIVNPPNQKERIGQNEKNSKDSQKIIHHFETFEIFAPKWNIFARDSTKYKT